MMKIIYFTGLLFLIGISLYIITIPIHEAVHWVLLTIEPEAKPLEYHIYDYKCLSEGHLGLVTWAGKQKLFNDFTHELLANIIQFSTMFIIAYMLMPHIIKFAIKREWLNLKTMEADR